MFDVTWATIRRCETCRALFWMDDLEVHNAWHAQVDGFIAAEKQRQENDWYESQEAE